MKRNCQSADYAKPNQAARAGKPASTWMRRICLTLAAVVGLQGTLAQAQTVYYHNDAGGSPVAATDESGALLWRESYRPFGERMLKPAAANSQWFHGKQLDPDTGLEDFGARNYDPVVGRFLSVDPVDFSEKNILQSSNRYLYANNSPYKYKDPDGRFAIPLLFVLFAGVLVAAAAVSSNPSSNVGANSGGGGLDPSLRQGSVQVNFLDSIFTRSEEEEGGEEADGVQPPAPAASGADQPLNPNEPPQPNENNLDIIKGNKAADKVAQEAGYRDAHDAKDGRGDSRMNIYNDKTTGQKWLWDGKTGSWKDML